MSGPWDIEGAVSLVYAKGDLDPHRSFSVVRIANALFGPGGVVEKGSRHVPGEAMLVPRDGPLFAGWPGPANPRAFQVWARRRLPLVRKRFAIGHEIGEWVCEFWGYRGEDREDYCDAIGAALLIFRPLFFREFGCPAVPDLERMAEFFGVDQACAALRFGEVTGTPVALVSRMGFKQRGEAFVFGPHEQLERIAFGGAHDSRVHVVPLTDDRRRVLLVAR